MKWHDPFRKTKGRIPRLWRAPGTYQTKRKWPVMPRQAMILHLYNAGLETHEVAEIMQVTVETLRKHMARIYYKCGVHDRGAAIRKGIGHEHSHL
jgi:DNA-binding NarL/FixJ family response regulator